MMKVSDVTVTLEDALVASFCNSATDQHRPWLLSDNDSCDTCGELVDGMASKDMDHVRSALGHSSSRP